MLRAFSASKKLSFLLIVCSLTFSGFTFAQPQLGTNPQNYVERAVFQTFWEKIDLKGKNKDSFLGMFSLLAQGESSIKHDTLKIIDGSGGTKMIMFSYDKRDGNPDTFKQFIEDAKMMALTETEYKVVKDDQKQKAEDAAAKAKEAKDKLAAGVAEFKANAITTTLHVPKAEFNTIDKIKTHLYFKAGELPAEYGEVIDMSASGSSIFLITSQERIEIIQDYLTSLTADAFRVHIIVRAITADQNDMFSFDANLKDLGIGSAMMSYGGTAAAESLASLIFETDDFTSALSVEKSKGNSLRVAELSATVDCSQEELVEMKSTEFRPQISITAEGVPVFQETEAGEKLIIKDLSITNLHEYQHQIKSKRQALKELYFEGEEAKELQRLQDEGAHPSVIYEKAQELTAKFDKIVETEYKPLFKQLEIRFKYEVSSGSHTSEVSSGEAVSSGRGESYNKGEAVVRHGKTVFLGGFQNEITKDSQRRLPVLGDIPVFGLLFGSTSEQESKSEIAFTTSAVIESHYTQKYLRSSFDLARNALEKGVTGVHHPWRTLESPTQEWIVSHEKDDNGQYIGAGQRVKKKFEGSKPDRVFAGEAFVKAVIAPLKEGGVIGTWRDLDIAIGHLETMDTRPKGELFEELKNLQAANRLEYQGAKRVAQHFPGIEKINIESMGTDGLDFIERLTLAQIQIWVTTGVYLELIEVLANAREEGRIGGVSNKKKHPLGYTLEKGVLTEYMREKVLNHTGEKTIKKKSSSRESFKPRWKK
ncbi:MAG: hypothetical protein ACPGJV_09680 [Bacteriovoracaceae bacterium]